MPTKITGILGGMGPEATAFYYTQLIKKTAARTDQEHIHVVVEANPQTPDRTRGIFGLGESALPSLLTGIERLNRIGIDQAFITCITSHHYFEEMKQIAQFDLIHALDFLYDHLKAQNITKVGLLATSGTLKTQLFQTALKDIEVLVPNDVDQEQLVMQAIYHPDTGIKSGHLEGLCLDQLLEVSQTLIQEGAQVIIGGCTEIAMILANQNLTVPMVDPIMIVIEDIIKRHKEAL
jgi:aspartate racemase